MIYAYAPGRGAEHAARILDACGGVLQVDGYAACKTVRGRRGPDAPLVLAHCRAHGRRQLREIFDRDAPPIAEEGLRRIARLSAEVRPLELVWLHVVVVEADPVLEFMRSDIVLDPGRPVYVQGLGPERHELLGEPEHASDLRRVPTTRSASSSRRSCTPPSGSSVRSTAAVRRSVRRR